ncbi:hypothetical protein NIES2130_36070 [Scytonema sp. HK-05]|nr:hypothetical protein NIES2130_36070 [Scytonema sp. HK-05]
MKPNINQIKGENSKAEFLFNSYQLSVTSYQFHRFLGKTPHQERGRRWWRVAHPPPYALRLVLFTVLTSLLCVLERLCG